MFIHFGVQWAETISPQRYIPLASDLPEEILAATSLRAQSEGSLRTFVEAFVALDPLLADVLYKIDRRLGARASEPFSVLPLTGWQSYGRPEILSLNKLVETAACAQSDTGVILPCARSRPYHKSKTHRKIWRKLNDIGVDRSGVDQIVVSSIGVIPEELWEHPVVRAYDSGVPDIYRVLRLMRAFFAKTSYQVVVDCLEFQPYSDCLTIIARERLIGEIKVLASVRKKRLPPP